MIVNRKLKTDFNDRRVGIGKQFCVFGINLFLDRLKNYQKKSLSRHKQCATSWLKKDVLLHNNPQGRKFLRVRFIKGTFLFITFCWNEQWCEFRFMHGRWYISRADLSNANNTVNIFCLPSSKGGIITKKCSCYLRHSVCSPERTIALWITQTSNCFSAEKKLF